MQRVPRGLALIAGLCFPMMLAADVLVFQPSPVDIYDLDHHKVYTWRVNNVDLGGKTVTGATLSFSNIRNWDSNPNTLFLHLLDTAKYAGVAQFTDDPTGSAPVTDITDDFVATRYHSQSGWLVAAGTSDTFLTAPSFTTTATNYAVNFSAAQDAILQNYILNGSDFAIGLDPDCHYFNDGVKFVITTQPSPSAGVPEPASVALFGTVIAGLVLARRHARRRSC